MSPSGSSLTPLAPFYRAHYPWLVDWLKQRTRGGDNAADLAQDTFMRLLIKGVDTAAVASPRAYLSTIARGLLVDQWRRADLERAYLEVLATQPEAVQPSVEERALALEMLRAVERMLRGLAERPREAFLLARLSGLTYQEIGGRLGVSERMVKKYMAQALLHCVQLRDEVA